MSPTTLMPVFLSPGSVMVIPRLNREMVEDLEAFYCSLASFGKGARIGI
jgi:hypothetical protein